MRRLQNTIKKAAGDYSELIGALWMCCNMVVAVYLLIRTYQQLYAVIFFLHFLHFFFYFIFGVDFCLRGTTTQFFTRFSTHFPTPGEVQGTRRTLVTGRRAPRLKTMVELVLQSTFRILDERFEYSFSVENEERK